jgi:hypothetical protein
MKAGIIIAGLVGLGAGFSLGWVPAPSASKGGRHVQRAPVRPAPEPAALHSESAPTAAESLKPRVASAAGGQDAGPLLSPRKRLFRRMMRGWPLESRHGFLWYLLVGHKEAQARLLEFLMSTPDAAACEAGQDLLIANHEHAFVRRLIEAFGSENHVGRRSMLAHALGGNARNPEARVLIEQILGGADAVAMRHVLTRLNMESFGDRSDAGVRIEARLRDLVTSGPTAEIRQQAVLSLRGGSSEVQIRFLLNLIDGNSDPQVRRAAIRSLPVTFMSPAPLVDEQLFTLWAIVRNEACDPAVRRTAAGVLQNSRGMGRIVATEADQELVKKLVETKP